MKHKGPKTNTEREPMQRRQNNFEHITTKLHKRPKSQQQSLDPYVKHSLVLIGLSLTGISIVGTIFEYVLSLDK